LIVIVILSFNLTYQRDRILEANKIKHIIKEEYLASPDNNNLSYYYEPKADTFEEVKVDWLDYKPRYHYNSDGLHEEKDYSLNKPKRVNRIITLGDSFTFGQYLENTADNWTEQLEAKLNKSTCARKRTFEVINLGVFGYDIEYSAERFKRKGLKYNPDLVIWYLKDDDFKIINESFIPLERQITKDMGIERDSPEYYFSSGVVYPSWQRAIKEYGKLHSDKKVLDYQHKVIKRLLSIYKKPLLFITFPKTQVIYRNFLRNLSTNQNTYLNENIPDIYKESRAVLPDFHPNKKGHKLITENVFTYLIKNNLIPCW